MTEKILLVDDESSVLAVVGKLLEMLGYEHATAANGREALACLQKDSFDLLLSDIHMPEMSGLELVEHARKSDPHLGIIMITGAEDLRIAVQVMKAGANDYLPKPVQFDALHVSIEKCLEHRRLQLEVQAYQTGLEDKVAQRTDQLMNALNALQQAHQAVKQAYFDMVTVLAKAAESNDMDTGHHIRRVSAYVAAIANHIGMENEKIEQLVQYATVHDIGKVTVHPDILKKQGKLTRDEFEKMKLHTVHGAEILRQVSSLTMAVNIAMHHHERYDGTGYPHGLAGDAIPDVAQITSIADVFDALTMQRCYKDAWSIDRAMELIQDERGRQFDPVLVDAFLECSGEIVAIREQFPD